MRVGRPVTGPVMTESPASAMRSATRQPSAAPVRMARTPLPSSHSMAFTMSAAALASTRSACSPRTTGSSAAISGWYGIWAPARPARAESIRA